MHARSETKATVPASAWSPLQEAALVASHRVKGGPHANAALASWEGPSTLLVAEKRREQGWGRGGGRGKNGVLNLHTEVLKWILTSINNN